MESKDELKEIDIKIKHIIILMIYLKMQIFILVISNWIKKYMKIFQSDISEKTSMGQKTLHIKINKMDGFAKINGEEFRHLVLFYNGLFDKICDKIKYLLSKKKWYYRQY